MHPLKILVFSYEFPPFKGGAGIYSRDLSIGLASQGVDVHVLTVSNKQGSELINGVHLHFFEGNSRNDALKSLCCLQLRYFFDIILVTERRAQEDMDRIPKDLLPYAAVIHGSEILSYFGNHVANLPITRTRMADFYKRAKICIAVSKATADMVAQLFPGTLPIVTVPNGIDLGRLRAASEDEVQSLRQSLPQNAQIVFCLGRLDLDKGQDVLIRAFASVRRTCPRAYLLIGGAGPNRTALEALCKELQLESCIKFLGEIPAVILPAFFSLCDLFAMPSKCDQRWEGFGLVFLEAGYYGKPVIGGNEGGVPEAIAHQESGILVDPRDSEAVAASIVALLTDREISLSMGEKGRQRVIRYFNAKRMAEDTLNHLHAILCPPTSKGRLSRIRLWGWSVLYTWRMFAAHFFSLLRRTL